MNKFLSKLAAPLEIIKIIAKHEPLYLFYALPQIVLNAFLPLLYVYFPKLIIEHLTSKNPYSDVIKTITIYGCILLFINITNVFLKNKSGMRSITFSSKLRNEIGKISMRLELKDIESPQAQDIMQMANKAADLTGAMGLVQNIVSNIITILGLVYIIVWLDWLFILLVAVTLTIKIIFVRFEFIHVKKINKFLAENDRHGSYLYNIAYSEGGAKEIRLNSLQKWYMDKTKTYRNTMVNTQLGSFRRYSVHQIIMAVLFALQSFVILWLLAGRYIDGVVSIADFTMYFSAVTALTECLSSITEQLGNYNQQILNVFYYKKFMDMINFENNKNTVDTPEFIIPDKIEFIFQEVSFAYPNTDKQILDNVNIKITDKEKLVIVGMNGAGKSTFIKLLCKFYRPASGKITLNGVDIWDMPNEEYYKIISAVFQDFANLSFTLKENIAMNDNGDMDKIAEIIDGVGLKERIDELSNGYETYLTKSFDSGGIEFSGGQAQKIAIARAVYKNTPMLILDEPTANLDPKAEGEIYTDFFNMAKNKTTIFISHRLAVSTIADNIAVFSDGKIAEYGSHNELMKQNGIYAEMYRKQSQQYTEEKVIF
ncbi:MAG: ABC transporter ATP-binding protein/permease [Oscillospiraceae bacterium]|nr:ABC transporter ATP-binding protein/permease [Oscillospiraceae bacterium]